MNGADVFNLEKEKIQKWTASYGGNKVKELCFGCIDKHVNSYFESSNEEENTIKEYDFRTAADIREELDLLWNDEKEMCEIKTAAVVSAMKGEKLINLAENLEKSKGADNRLKDYVYNFY